MKREFLQNLQAADAPLSKEVIDAIMEENGRDIENAKKPYGDYAAIQQELARLRETIKDYEAQDVDGLRQNAQDWERKYYVAVQNHAAQMAQLRFDGILSETLRAAGGRNPKAITALLDVAALQSSEDPQAAVEQAVAQLKQECDYLFTAQTPPPYARGTGSRAGAMENQPVTLAGALREKFERK